MTDTHKVHIYKTVIDHFPQIVADKHGCCVVQKCLEISPLEIQVNVLKDNSFSLK